MRRPTVRRTVRRWPSACPTRAWWCSSASPGRASRRGPRSWFDPPAIVSCDDLRAIVGRHRHDLRATKDATRGPRADRHQAPAPRPADRHRLDRPRPGGPGPLPRLADRAGVACHAVVVDTPERETRARNRAPAGGRAVGVVTSQLEALAAAASRRRWTTRASTASTASPTASVAVVPRSLYDAPGGRPAPTGGSHDDALRPAARRLVLARRRRRDSRPASAPSPAPPRRSGSRRSR